MEREGQWSSATAFQTGQSSCSEKACPKRSVGVDAGDKSYKEVLAVELFVPR